MKQIHDIYDRIAKRCISLSSRCTINLINGLYGTNYPPDSEVTYNWTENTDDELKRTLADTIITINRTHSYHIEFQMTKDGDIILRTLDYGFHHALLHPDVDTITFPEPIIIYLYDRKSFPDEYVLKIKFGNQGFFDYRIPVYKYLEKPLSELDEKKMIVLIPFQLLRLRHAIEKSRSKENMDALKRLVTHDIMDSLNKNVAVGNITQNESLKIRRMILHLYRHIYGAYEELKEEGVNQMAEDALIFDIDILDHKMRKLEEKNDTLTASIELLEEQKQSLEAQKQSLEATNQSLEATNQSLEATNQSLEAQVRALTAWKLSARGFSTEEIAEQIGITPDAVLAILTAE